VASVLAQGTSVIKEILVRGNTTVNTEAILAAIQTGVGRPFLPDQLLKDEQSIRDLGFFRDVKILSRALGDNQVQLVVEVQEFPVVREIKVSGNTVISTEKILTLVTLPLGQVFNLRNVGPTVEAIAAQYQKDGYFAQADITLSEVSPGTMEIGIIERTVNDIIVEGLGRTKPWVLRRLLKTKPDTAFNEVLWANDRRRLESTQWFESLDASSLPTGDIGRFDLQLNVKEARTAQIGLGATLDPRSRLAGSFRLSDSNFRGMGQTLGVNLQQDVYGSGLSASLYWLNPYYDERDTSVAVDVYSRVNNYFINSSIGNTANNGKNDRFDERRTGGSITVSRPFRSIYSFTFKGGFEDIQTVNENTATTNYIQQNGNLTTLSFALSRDTRDVVMDPAEGDYVRFALEPALSNISKIGGLVAGDSQVLGRNVYVRNVLDYRKFWSRRPTDPKKLADPRRVLAFRARLGYLSGTSPFYEQFFAGGSDSLRGYADQRFWGNQLLITSLEYRIPIQKTFTTAVFADYGGAWGGYGKINSFEQTKTMKLVLGYGAGILFRTPFGPIRIDYAFNQYGGSRTHFSIGGLF